MQQGQLVWSILAVLRAGALTNAVQSGKWVLIEDVELCPMEIHAALVKLLEERILHLGNGEGTGKAHPNFQIFGTCITTTNTANSLSDGGGGNRKKEKIYLEGKLTLQDLVVEKSCIHSYREKYMMIHCLTVN